MATLPFSISYPAGLRELMGLFARHGERLYPVGGCVRDTLLGEPPHDWDVAVTTDPKVTAAICTAAGYRVIPTGLKHGTVTVLVPRSGNPADREGPYDPMELTTCRTEGAYTDGRHPDAVSFTGRIEDDLSRRDFTVNAMALSEDGEGNPLLIDLFGGREDLEAGIIRCVGDPDTRFTEDGLRLLRAVRFAVKLGAELEPATAAAVSRQAHRLALISRERIRDEFQKTLCSPRPERGVALLGELGLLPHVLPHGISPAGTGRLSELPPHFPLRMACLVFGADPRGMEEDLAGLRLSNTERREILTLARSHTFPLVPTPRGAREWRHAHGELSVPALLLRLAHAHGDTAPAAETSLLALVRESEARGEAVSIGDLAINGHDLIALGFKPGRPLQDVLCDLLELVWERPEYNTTDTLTREALRRRD